MFAAILNNSIMRNTIVSLLLLLFASSSFSQTNEKKKGWDVSTPSSPFTSVTISSDEGTWMSLDVSPDGSKIVFDMLGDIYIMPVRAVMLN
jgi:hypothetical protein